MLFVRKTIAKKVQKRAQKSHLTLYHVFILRKRRNPVQFFDVLLGLQQFYFDCCHCTTKNCFLVVPWSKAPLGLKWKQQKAAIQIILINIFNNFKAIWFGIYVYLIKCPDQSCLIWTGSIFFESKGKFFLNSYFDTNGAFGRNVLGIWLPEKGAKKLWLTGELVFSFQGSKRIQTCSVPSAKKKKMLNG